MVGNRKWDLIHFNWGLHDLKYMGKDGANLVPKEKGGVVQVPLSEYEKNLEKLAVRMKKSAKRLVWRNTTPIPLGSRARYVGDSVKYNEAAARVMKKHNIPTLDLFTPSKKNMKDWMKKADVHYYPHGSQALAGFRQRHSKTPEKIVNAWPHELRRVHLLNRLRICSRAIGSKVGGGFQKDFFPWIEPD